LVRKYLYLDRRHHRHQWDLVWDHFYDDYNIQQSDNLEFFHTEIEI